MNKNTKILILSLILFTLPLISATVDNSQHINYQKEDAGGNGVPGTYDFIFSIHSSSDCSDAALFTQTFNDEVTDGKGKISVSLTNVNVDFSSNKYLKVTVDSVQDSCSLFHKISNSYYSDNLIDANNLTLTTHNISASYFFGDGSKLTNVLASISNIFNQWLNTTSNVHFNNLSITSNITAGEEVYINGISVKQWLYNQSQTIYYYNQTLAGDIRFLMLNGSNANQNIAINNYNLSSIGNIEVNNGTLTINHNNLTGTSGNEKFIKLRQPTPLYTKTIDYIDFGRVDAERGIFRFDDNSFSWVHINDFDENSVHRSIYDIQSGASVMNFSRAFHSFRINQTEYVNISSEGLIVKGNVSATEEVYVNGVKVSTWLYNQTQSPFFYNMSDGAGSGNSSWNESYADTLYSNIQWNYNQTQSPYFYNQTASPFFYNQTASPYFYNFSTQVFNVTFANVSAGTYFGDGSKLTGVVASMTNIFNQWLNTTSNVHFNNMTITNNLTVGEEVYINGVSVKQWLYNQSQTIYYYNQTASPYFYNQSATPYFYNFSTQIYNSTFGNVSAAYFFGDGSKLTNIPNTISFWKATATTLYNDTANVKVGIGVSTPSDSLTVKGGNVNISDDNANLTIGNGRIYWNGSSLIIKVN